MSKGPRTAYLLPTGRCNLHCSGCYATLNEWGRLSKAGELSIDDYRTVVRDLHELGVRTFDISGGEPLLYPHLVDLCRAIRSHDDTRILLVTNGTIVKQHQLEALSTLVERLVISLDAPYPALHDELRGQAGAFDTSLATLRAARALPFPEIAVNQLLCRPNTSSVADMIRLCRDERIDRLSLLSHRDVSENGVMPDLIPDLDALVGAWDTVAAEITRGDHPKWVDIVAPSFLYPETTQFRQRLPRDRRARITFLHPHLRGGAAFRDTVVVKPFGVLTGDTAMVNTDFFDLGSVKSGVRHIWETMAPVGRQQLAEREQRLRAEAPCRDCSRWHVCRGGCPAAARHQWGAEWRHDRSGDHFRAAAAF
jgi:radical SAM protein with 4Fe4S-binding SPASM domain